MTEPRRHDVRHRIRDDDFLRQPQNEQADTDDKSVPLNTRARGRVNRGIISA
jgi:hypothetical protein